jgi:hypothetical protein
MLICAVSVPIGAMTGTAASAASQFTESATGTLTGDQENNQIVTPVSGGPAIVYTAAHATGSIISTATTTLEVTVVYSGGTIPALFAAPVDNSSATFELHASGAATIANNIVINATGLGCSTTIAAGQTLGTVSYTNLNSNTEVTVSMSLSGIHSTGTGLCPSGTTGTYTGNFVIHRVGGGFVRWDS